MARDHHEYQKIPLGESDIAQLLLRRPAGCELLEFGEDGGYSAYLVDEECEVPAHYIKIMECRCWLWIYSDTQRTVRINAPRIAVYRCGMKGCIIRTFGESSIETNIFTKGEEM